MGFAFLHSMIKAIFAVSFLAITQLTMSGIDPDYNIPCKTASYNQSIRTVMMYHAGNELAPAYLELNGPGNLELRFDDLRGDFRNLYYTVFHCTSDWDYSDIDQSEYLEGMYENSINDYEQAFNTYTDFTHYTCSFPNDMSSLLLSGNYLMVVYEDGDVENVVLTHRFIVYEQLVNVTPNIHQSTIVTEQRYDQEIDVTVSHTSYDIPNPYNDFDLVILQNNRWDNAIVNLKPRFVKNDELDFDYGEENNFRGGNEFRNVDLKNTDFVTLQIDHYSKVDDEFHAWLKPVPSRAFIRYQTFRDINGRYLIRNDDGFNSHLEADYIWVHFTLPWDYPLPNGSSMHVFGALSNWQALLEFALAYDYNEKAYKAAIQLKQGYYDYQYVIKSGEEIDATLVEGNHFETENEYTIFAYNYEMTRNYDRVVGAVFFNSFD